MKRIRMWLGVALAAAAWIAPAALAECPEVDREVDRALEELRGDREKLGECSIPHVRGLVEQAVDHLREARRESDGDNCRRALLHVAAARNLTSKARELCQDEGRHRDRVIDFLNQTDHLLARTQGDLGDVAGRECSGLFRMAREQQANAWRQFRAEKPRFALSLSGSARRTLESALRCTEGGAAGEEVLRELERTDAVLERASESDYADPRLMDAATQLQRSAWDQFEIGRYNLSLRLTFQVRVLAVRAATAEDRAEPRVVEDLIGSTSELITEIQGQFYDRGDELGQNLLRRSRELLDQARESLADGDARIALALARQASAMALQAADRLMEGGR